jgi:hypothetical protein
MHKNIRRRVSSSNKSSQAPGKQVLQFSKETIRALTSTELSHAASGCPFTSGPTTVADDSGACV